MNIKVKKINGRRKGSEMGKGRDGERGHRAFVISSRLQGENGQTLLSLSSPCFPTSVPAKPRLLRCPVKYPGQSRAEPMNEKATGD